MSKRPREKLYEWRITRIRATPAALVGHVEAPNAEQAVKAAIEKYEITNPHEQARLAAQRVKEAGA
jgi:predicted chitinase